MQREQIRVGDGLTLIMYTQFRVDEGETLPPSLSTREWY